MHSGSYLLDVFVFDNTQFDGLKKFLWALIQQNPRTRCLSRSSVLICGERAWIWPRIQLVSATHRLVKRGKLCLTKMDQKLRMDTMNTHDIYPHPGWVEQNMEEVWEGLCKASQLALNYSANHTGATIQSIGFSSQRGTFALLGENEKLLGPAVVWSDSRKKKVEKKLRQLFPDERYRAITGMPISSSWTLAKIVWLKKYRSEIMKRVRWIVNGQEYFLRGFSAETDLPPLSGPG